MGWYFSKALHTYYSAFVLSQLPNELLQKFAAEAPYGGSGYRTAISEAFRREAAISLELISKASLATHIREKSTQSGRTTMPNTHNLFELFADIGIELTTNRQVYFLDELTETLIWSGRYGAPAKGKPDHSRGKKYDAMIDKATWTDQKLGALVIHQYPSLSWADFEDLFQLVLKSIHSGSWD